MKRKKGTYYDKNRSIELAKVNSRYKKNKKYRDAARKSALNRYHKDKVYREKTIENAKRRYRKIKSKKKLHNS